MKCAGRYDDQSRTGMVELEKPAGFKFEPGQYVLLNLPWIGKHVAMVHVVETLQSEVALF